jgi:hypothetical protein
MRVPAELLYSCFSKTAQSNDGPRLRDLFSVGGVAALLGGGYLANKGVENLFNMKAPGTFRNTLEQGILAQHNAMQAEQLQRAAIEAGRMRSKLTNRNMMLGGALAMGLIPLYLATKQS